MGHLCDYFLIFLHDLCFLLHLVLKRFPHTFQPLCKSRKFIFPGNSNRIVKDLNFPAQFPNVIHLFSNPHQDENNKYYR